MQVGMTIQERIKQAERIPRYGSVDRMIKCKSLRQKLVGFAKAQMTNWEIIKSGDTFVTNQPDTATSVTFTDDEVLIFASIIRQFDIAGSVSIDEAPLYKLILDEAAIIEERNNPTEEDQETETTPEYIEGEDSGQISED